MKKELLTVLLVLGCSAGCYAATPLPKVDSQQRELAGNMLGEQEKLILDSEDLSGQAEKDEVKIYIKAYSLDTSEITKALSPPDAFGEIQRTKAERRGIEAGHKAGF
ncbi:MAG: hypothetical protein LUC29_02010 [Acidaminococcaceae bacterium]|nr:hypothetical protein [Acidaminococcaceae bacterium]